MIEVEFIPIGEETNTGDAILVHFTEPVVGTERVVLVDGGFKETYLDVARHVRAYYGTDTIDLMVCTHPDDDHINGLFGVLDELDVRTLLIHQPSSFGYQSDDVKASKVDDLIAQARSGGTAVHVSDFAGTSYFNGAITVAGPTEEFYKAQLAAQTQSGSLAASVAHAFRVALSAVGKRLSSVFSDPGEGTLTDDGGTTPRNNSSIVLDIQVDGYRVLLTGDAGVPALSAVADTLDLLGRSNAFPDLFDVPHHGSRHNLDTDTANRLLGPIVGNTSSRSAFVSVGKKAEDFPRPEVANAFTRRGYGVCATRGQTIRWNRNAPTRAGWGPITPLGWQEVE